MESENNKLYEALNGNFALQKTGEYLPENLTLENIRCYLIAAISELMDSNMEKLLGILYRIDVSQSVTDDIFKNTRGEIPALLADAIIQRQLLKLKTRDKYKNK